MENTTEVGNITAVDADGDNLSFSFVTDTENPLGADNNLFSITENGELSFNESPNFENPADSDGDNIYEVGIEVSDGINSTRDLITVSVNNENDLPILEDTLTRFQNSNVRGTYLFAGEEEAQSVRRDFSPPFVEEGEAFKVSLTEDDDLVRFNRFQNNDVQGTFLFATEEESVRIRQDFPQFEEEGIAFYAYDANAGVGTDVIRFNNRNLPGTYIFALEDEARNIRQNFGDIFIEEGVAFEAIAI